MSHTASLAPFESRPQPPVQREERAAHYAAVSDPARFIEAVDRLVSCKDLTELAEGAARLAQELFGSADLIVLLRSPEGETIAEGPSTSAALRAWFQQLPSDAATQGLVVQEPSRGAAGYWAAGIDASERGVQGLIAVAHGGSIEPSQCRLLAAIANLAATCCTQIRARQQAASKLQVTKSAVAQGLHDLCTPLNSLRLGLHLLEPAVSMHDSAVAQRTHRAIDRMAALVTDMFAVVHEEPVHEEPVHEEPVHEEPR